MNEHCICKYSFRRSYKPALVFVALAGLLSVQASRAESGGQMNIQYGHVSAAKPVDVKKHTGEAALVGGTLGAATSSLLIDSGSKTGNLLGGAAVGAGLAAGVEYIGEWRMKGTRYTIDTDHGEDIHIITDQTGIHIGDCVAIEATAKHANLRRVSDTYCETASDGTDDHHLDARARKAAADCYLAKKALLGAEGREEVEAAKRRVRALCDT